MTPEEINATIAKECGWQLKEVFEPSFSDSSKQQSRGLKWHNPHGLQTRAPNYFTDLNACHDAEVALGITQIGNSFLRVKWINALREIVGRECPKNKAGASLVSDVDLVTATAPQHCEAILRAIGLWKD